MKEGDVLTLTGDVSYTNVICDKLVKITTRKGTKISLISQRPEGWMAKTEDNQYTFIFNRDIEQFAMEEKQP